MQKENRQGRKEAYIRQVYRPGETCEFDRGEIKLEISGKRRSFQLAVFTSAYGNYRYAFIYERQDTLAFMESHVRFFQIIGGVYHKPITMNTIHQQITAYSKELRLPRFSARLQGTGRRSGRGERLDYEAYPVKLMEREYDLRPENRKKAQIRNARFPSKRYLSELERSQLPPAAQEKLPIPERRDWILWPLPKT
jgi:hypothetical protein